MTQGLPAGPVGPTDGAPLVPPDDTGEAIGLPPGGLTITFGFGPGLFRDAHGRDRFGLADRRPEALARPAALPGRRARPGSGRAATSACRPARRTRRSPSTRSATWPGSASGPSRSAGRSWASAVRRPRRPSQSTPRNLFGFKDGTAQRQGRGERRPRRSTCGSARDDDQDWLAGGSYLVARRINMHIETWDRQGLQPQEDVDRPDQGHRCAAVRRHRVHAPRPVHAGVGRAADPGRLARRRGQPRAATAASGCCAAATTSSTAPTPSVAWTPGSSSSRSSATPRTHFIPLQNADGVERRDDGVPPVHRLGDLRRPPGVGPGEYVGQSLFA